MPPSGQQNKYTQHLLSEAAALSGMPSINSFLLNAAVEKAKDVIHTNAILNNFQGFDADHLNVFRSEHGCP